MRVSGFTIIRNGVRFAYPFEESVRSLLPLVDELHVGVGKSEDDTLERVQAIDSPKIQIFETEWDLENREGGKVLSEQTNLALDRCEGDWCFYLQADEVIHEDDYDIIRDAMERYLDNERVLGLWFDYLHFKGDYHLRNALGYRTSVRIIRGGSPLRSIRDASKFGWSHEKPLRERPFSRARPTGARIFHYGVRAPAPLHVRQVGTLRPDVRRGGARRSPGPGAAQGVGIRSLGMRTLGGEPSGGDAGPDRRQGLDDAGVRAHPSLAQPDLHQGTTEEGGPLAVLPRLIDGGSIPGVGTDFQRAGGVGVPPALSSFAFPRLATAAPAT